MLPLTLALSYVRVAYGLALKKQNFLTQSVNLKRVTQGE
jgi:hypothetical protein